MFKIVLNYYHLDALVLLGIILTIIRLRRKQRTLLPLPPGPKGWPIIGNTLEMPQSEHWEVYKSWSDQYGDIVYTHQYGRPIIIVNSFKAVYELLDRRSSNYSSRPHYVMFHELMDFGGLTSFQPYGDTWRKHRALYNQQLNSNAIEQFQNIQVNAVRGLLRLLFEAPENFASHLWHMSAAIVLDFAYGYKIEPVNDPLVNLLEGVAVYFAKGTRPSAYLVDSFPILKHIPVWWPYAAFRREAEEARAHVRQTRDLPFRDVKSQLKTGKARPSFVANSLSNLGIDDESNVNVDAVKRVASGILAAGSNTTSSTLSCFILAMALYPNVMKKAQAELDSVVGRGRLPEYGDRSALPYIDAIVKETLRWCPVFPSALPHATIAEDVYEGYRIPAGSSIIPNAWSILHDPEIYSDPMGFRPERFLPGSDGKPAERDPYITGCFGFGRRICAGKNLADTTLWLTIASVLSTFDVTNALDEHGGPIPHYSGPNPTGGVVCNPKPFSCSISVRSKEMENLLRSIDTS